MKFEAKGMKMENAKPDKKKAKSEPKATAPGRGVSFNPSWIKATEHLIDPSIWQFDREEQQRLIDSNRRIFLAVERLSAAQLAQLLAEPGVNVNLRDKQGMTPLHHAAASGARPCIRLLVASGKCDYLIRDSQGRYAFELAIEWARDYAVGRLLAKKQAQQAAAQGVTAYELRA